MGSDSVNSIFIFKKSMKLLKFSVNFQILRQNFSFKNLIKINLIWTRFLETHQGTLKVKTNQNRWIVDKLATISDQQPPSWFRVADSRTGASISRCKIQCQTLKKCRPKEPTISRNAVNRLTPDFHPMAQVQICKFLQGLRAIDEITSFRTVLRKMFN